MRGRRCGRWSPWRSPTLILISVVGALGVTLAAVLATPQARLVALRGEAAAPLRAGAPGAAESIVAVPTVVLPLEPQVDSRFQAYVEQHGGVRIFGLPLGPAEEGGGRTVQWFERARLEYVPAGAGSAPAIQRGRVGAELTAGRVFPTRLFGGLFAPEWRGFAETGYGMTGAFRAFWEQHGGVAVFGYPISEELEETIEGQPLTVQYFERARLELHPNLPPPYSIQLGLLGRELRAANATALPTPVPPPLPTPYF